MMHMLVFLAALNLSVTKNTKYREILQDDGKLRKLYQNYKHDMNIDGLFNIEEDIRRFEIFTDNLKLVVSENEVNDETAEFTLNKFSILTEEEKLSWTTGLRNPAELEGYIAGLEPYNPEPSRKRRSTHEEAPLPEEKMWTDSGYVTEVQDQGWCGSCWAFAAVATMETNYAIATGVLKKFSEQEATDCSFQTHPGWEGWESGCDGGWAYYTFSYVKDTKRLALGGERNGSYTYSDKVEGRFWKDACLKDDYENAMIGANVVGYKGVDGTEDAHVRALYTSAITVCYHVTDRFYTYERGIYRDSTCGEDKWPNHCSVMVGYAVEYFLVKNSWGTDWGDRGFVKFDRSYHNCGLLNWSIIPIFEVTGVDDESVGDAATKYNPRHSEPSDDCEDEQEDCDLHFCFDPAVEYTKCRRTCHTCDVDFDEEEEEEGKCGNGLTRCDEDPTGPCRHRHICRFLQYL